MVPCGVLCLLAVGLTATARPSAAQPTHPHYDPALAIPATISATWIASLVRPLTRNQNQSEPGSRRRSGVKVLTTVPSGRSGTWSVPCRTHGPWKRCRTGAAERLIGRTATMGRALVRPDQTLVDRRLGRARRHHSNRRGDERRDVGFASSPDLEWLGACRHLGVLSLSATGTRFPAPERTAGASGRIARADHHEGANCVRRGRGGRLPGALPPPAPAITPAVAPNGPRHITSAGEGAGAVDLTRRGRSPGKARGSGSGTVLTVATLTRSCSRPFRRGYTSCGSG